MPRGHGEPRPPGPGGAGPTPGHDMANVVSTTAVFAVTVPMTVASIPEAPAAVT